LDSGQNPETLYCGECGRPAAQDELARFGNLLICPACKNNYAQKLREGLAPAVVFRYAGFWIRFVAVFIDGIIMSMVNGIVQFAILGSFMPSIATPRPGMTPEELFTTFLPRVGLSAGASLLLHATYEALFINRLGATPGKLALGLKVVRPDGGPIGLGRAFGRYFAKLLNYFTLLIGYIIAGFDSQKRALHDMICDTRVIRTREI
jgi:uncharacterized RDD family membrane protein YckC